MIEMTPDEFRALGYRAIDLIAENMRALPDAPARPLIPAAVREGLLAQPLPETGRDAAAVIDAIGELVMPYPMGNASPRFFAWVNSSPAPIGVLADLLASAIDPSVAGGDHAATYVEHAALGWMKQLLGYPTTSGAILTSGGSVANLIGLAVMRYVHTEGKARTTGMPALPIMVVYTSTQGHSCIQKAIELLGFGSDNLRKIPVDANQRMDMAALRAQIAADRAAGLQPVCVAASAGTVNTGAIDPLDAIADLCAAEGLWFHIDGAYGGVGVIAEQTIGLYNGMERADSLAVDPHKWMYMPVECGCALVRDAEAMRNTFSLVPPYLRDDTSMPWFSEFGIQQSRGFRALKLWAAFQTIGADGYRTQISRDIALSRSLQARIRARTDFELVAAGPLSVACFRYAPAGAHNLNELNQQIAILTQREGFVYLTTTELDGMLLLRACIVNFRTSEADLDTLLDTLAEAGQRILRSENSL